MANDNKTISIDRSDLVAKLDCIEQQSEGDLARMIELLLLENHVLRQFQSSGFRRGIPVRYGTYPRFVRLDEGDREQSSKDR